MTLVVTRFSKTACRRASSLFFSASISADWQLPFQFFSWKPGHTASKTFLLGLDNVQCEHIDVVTKKWGGAHPLGRRRFRLCSSRHAPLLLHLHDDLPKVWSEECWRIILGWKSADPARAMHLRLIVIDSPRTRWWHVTGSYARRGRACPAVSSRVSQMHNLAKIPTEKCVSEIVSPG